MGGQGARSQSSESTFILCRHQGFSPYKARGWKPHRFVGWSSRGFIAQCFAVNRLLRSYLVLREYAARGDFVIVGEYVDYASGTREYRPQYQALFAAARRRHLDVV